MGKDTKRNDVMEMGELLIKKERVSKALRLCVTVDKTLTAAAK